MTLHQHVSMKGIFVFGNLNSCGMIGQCKHLFQLKKYAKTLNAQIYFSSFFEQSTTNSEVSTTLKFDMNSLSIESFCFVQTSPLKDILCFKNFLCNLKRAVTLANTVIFFVDLSLDE